MRCRFGGVFDESQVLPALQFAPMTLLRNVSLIARFMLAWFALSIVIAVASPLIKPQGMELICTGTIGVMKVVIQTDDGPQEVSTHTLDCPLCASMTAPPPVARLMAEPVQPLAYVMRSIPAACMASLTGGPPPARGPPVFS